MNHLVISAIVDSNELCHTKNSQPVCTLICTYEYENNDKTHRTSLTAIARGEEFAKNVHLHCPQGMTFILEGEYERYRPQIKEDYLCQLVLNRQPIFIDGDLQVNRFVLVGRTGGDPDIKYFESGAVKAAFSLATNRGKDIPPSWHNIEAWGQRAETIANYVRKGNQVGFVGKLIAQTWRDRETGAYRYKPLMKVDQVELLGSKREETG